MCDSASSLDASPKQLQDSYSEFKLECACCSSHCQQVTAPVDDDNLLRSRCAAVAASLSTILMCPVHAGKLALSGYEIYKRPLVAYLLVSVGVMVFDGDR